MDYMENQIAGLTGEKIGHWVLVFVRTFLTAPLEVFTKRDFGERYLPSWMIAIGAIFWFGFLGSGGVPSVPGMPYLHPLSGSWGAPTAAVIFVGLYVGVAVYHRRAMLARRKKAIMWHSQSPGIPHRILGPNGASFTHYAMIPVAGLGVGFLFAPLTWGVLMAMFWSGIAYIFEGMISAAIWRGRILDALDARILSKQFSEALEANDPEKQDGLYVPPVLLPEERASYGAQVGEALVGIDPRLRALRDGVSPGDRATSPLPKTANEETAAS